MSKLLILVLASMGSIVLLSTCSVNIGGLGMPEDDDKRASGTDVCAIMDEIDASCSDVFNDIDTCMQDAETMSDCDAEVDALLDCVYSIDDDIGQCGEDVFDCMYGCEDDEACSRACEDEFDVCTDAGHCREEGDDGDGSYDQCAWWGEIEQTCRQYFDAIDTCDGSIETGPDSCMTLFDEALACIRDMDPDMADCGETFKNCLDTCTDDACRTTCEDEFDMCAGIQDCNMGDQEPVPSDLMCEITVYNDCPESHQVYLVNDVCNPNQSMDTIDCPWAGEALPYESVWVATIPSGSYLGLAVCNMYDGTCGDQLSNNFYCDGTAGAAVSVPICSAP